MRIAITGGREHKVTRGESCAFYRLWNRLGGTVLIHGNARGVDREIGGRAEKRGIKVERVPVDNDLDGAWPGAGHRRNRRMLVRNRAEALIAFPGDKGTKGCAKIAKSLGIPVYFVADEVRPPRKKKVEPQQAIDWTTAAVEALDVAGDSADEFARRIEAMAQAVRSMRPVRRATTR